MISFQFSDSEPQTVETTQDVVSLLQKYIRLAQPYTIHVLDTAEGHLVLVQDYEDTAEKDATTDL